MNNIFANQDSHAKRACFVENAQQACEEVLLNSNKQHIQTRKLRRPSADILCGHLLSLPEHTQLIYFKLQFKIHFYTATCKPFGLSNSH